MWLHLSMYIKRFLASIALLPVPAEEKWNNSSVIGGLVVIALWDLDHRANGWILTR